MKMKFIALSACLITSLLASAGPVGAVAKGASKIWDDVAKCALKISGKEATECSVKATASNLSKIAEAQGDDAARLAAKGGVEAVEKSVVHGSKFTQLLMKSAAISDDAIKYAVQHSDDVLKYSTKYGDDVIVINAKAPGLSGRLIKALEGCPVEASLQKMAKLPKEDLPRAIGLLEKCEDAARLPYLKAIEKDGGKFIDKLLQVNAKQIMATGVAVSMVITATGVTIAGGAALNNVASGFVECSNATADNIRSNNQWALKTLNDPNASPEAKEEARKVLANDHARADIGGKLVNGLMVVVMVGGIVGVLWLMFKLRQRKQMR